MRAKTSKTLNANAKKPILDPFIFAQSFYNIPSTLIHTTLQTFPPLSKEFKTKCCVINFSSFLIDLPLIDSSVVLFTKLSISGRKFNCVNVSKKFVFKFNDRMAGTPVNTPRSSTFNLLCWRSNFLKLFRPSKARS